MTERAETAEVRLLEWDPAQGWQTGVPGISELEVADSWLVDEGRVRGLPLHRTRFFGACREVAGVPGDEELAGFWAAALAELPRRGRWFPRVELVRAAGRHALRVADQTGAGAWRPCAPDRLARPGSAGRAPPQGARPLPAGGGPEGRSRARCRHAL
jgi:hypothetical protein